MNESYEIITCFGFAGTRLCVHKAMKRIAQRVLVMAEKEAECCPILDEDRKKKLRKCIPRWRCYVDALPVDDKYMDYTSSRSSARSS